MNPNWIPILISAVIATSSVFLKKRFFNILLSGLAMLVLFIPLIQGNLFSFSYTSIFSLGYALMILLNHFLHLLNIKNKYIFSSIHFLPLLFGTVFSIPAIYIYGVQADNYKTYIYVAIAIGIALGIGTPFLLIRDFWKKDVLSKILTWLFFVISLGIFSYCTLSTIQSRYLLFYSLSLASLIASVSLDSFALFRVSNILRFLSILGVAVFVASPILF